MAFAIIANELILNIACWLASERRLYISPLDQRNVSLIDQKCLEQRKVSLTIKIHQRNLSLTDQKTVEQRNLSLLNRWPKPTRQRNLSLTDGKTVEQRNVSLLNGRKKPAPIAKPFANRRKRSRIAKGIAILPWTKIQKGQKEKNPIAKPFANRRKNCRIAKRFAIERQKETGPNSETFR